MIGVYLDHNSTTPLSPQVKAWISDKLESFGNPSSIHQFGRDPKLILREARKSVAKLINAHQLEIVFTSGASEGNNTVLQNVPELVAAKDPARREILVSSIEHPSVLKTLEQMERRGFIVRRIPVNRNGELDLSFIAKHLSNKTALISVMLANNEMGAIFPVREISAQAHAVGALIHTDAVQALGKIQVDLSDLGVDYATFSAHKFYALKGCGVLFVKSGAPFENLIFGGGQERGRRSGTENLIGIGAMSVMAEQAHRISKEASRLQILRDNFEAEVLKFAPDTIIVAKGLPRVPNTSGMIIPGVDGESLLMNLDMAGFAVSTGAACSAGSPEPSPGLLAMGFKPEEAQNSLRVSLGWETTETQMKTFVGILKDQVLRLKESGLWKQL